MFSLQTDTKRKLVDQDVSFTDGTCFNGDIFRMDKLMQKSTIENTLSLRLFSENNLLELNNEHDFDEVYCLMCSDQKYYATYKYMGNIGKCNYIQLSSFNDMKKLFK